MASLSIGNSSDKSKEVYAASFGLDKEKYPTSFEVTNFAPRALSFPDVSLTLGVGSSVVAEIPSADKLKKLIFDAVQIAKLSGYPKMLVINKSAEKGDK